MKYSAWASLKHSWRTTSVAQKVLTVLFFPVVFLFLVMIAWGMNKNGRSSGVTKS